MSRPFKDTLKPNTSIPETILESEEDDLYSINNENSDNQIVNTELEENDNTKSEYKQMIFQDMSGKAEELKVKEEELQNSYKEV